MGALVEQDLNKFIIYIFKSKLNNIIITLQNLIILFILFCDYKFDDRINKE